MSSVEISSSLPAYEDEAQLIAGLQNGDEAAFVVIVERYHVLLINVALAYVSTRAAAEEVVQETWLGVLRGIARFEARSSLKTWLLHILVNRAKTRAKRDSHTIPFSVIWSLTADVAEPAEDPEHFQAGGPDQGHWNAPPQDWSVLPEECLISKETRAVIEKVIESLPGPQRMVITLRDIYGCDSTEVCNVLGISETNQRVLLHRGRSRVRQALERYLGEG